MIYARCDECHNRMLVNERGYCGRCEHGWDGYLRLDHCTVGMLERELGLALYYLTTLEQRHGNTAPIADYVRKIERELSGRKKNVSPGLTLSE